MPDNIINCPQCERQLRVPEEMLGKLVKCPTCGMTFTVAAGGPAAPPPVVAVPPGPASEIAPHQPSARLDEFGTRAGDVTPWVAPPAIGLIVTGILGLLGSLLQFAMTALNPEGFQDVYTKFGLEPPPLALLLSIPGTCALFGFLVLLGAVQMFRLRSYPLALAACILAMMNLNNFCCVLGVPLGIWGLVVLLRPEVKSAFQ